MTTQAAWLLAGLFLAHCLGDFSPLATGRMQVAKANGGPMYLIGGHAAVHTVLVAAAVALLARPVWPLVLAAAGIELVTHFMLDAGRARLGHRFPALNDHRDNTFWYALGADQLAHGLVLVWIASFVLPVSG